MSAGAGTGQSSGLAPCLSSDGSQQFKERIGSNPGCVERGTAGRPSCVKGTYCGDGLCQACVFDGQSVFLGLDQIGSTRPFIRVD